MVPPEGWLSWCFEMWWFGVVWVKNKINTYAKNNYIFCNLLSNTHPPYPLPSPPSLKFPPTFCPPSLLCHQNISRVVYSVYGVISDYVLTIDNCLTAIIKIKWFIWIICNVFYNICLGEFIFLKRVWKSMHSWDIPLTFEYSNGFLRKSPFSVLTLERAT